VAGGANISELITIGAGECATAVAEELAFEQVARDRGAVEGDERLSLAIGEVVDRTREDLFAGSAFARNRPVAAGGVLRSTCPRTTARGCGDGREV
jgi:hypothetical protein